MATYYVSTSGNDTTGNGSQGTPWRTLTKAYAVAVSSDTILLADGVYQENGGGGYLYLGTRNNTDYITIQPVNGASGNVTVQGTSGTSAEVAVDTAKMLKFNYIKFTARDGTVLRVLRFFGANASNIQFYGCTFTVASSASTPNLCIQTTLPNGATLSNVTFDTCTCTQTGTNDADGIYLARPDPTATVDAVTVRNCSVIITRRPLRLEGTTNVVVDGNTLVATDVVAAAVCFALGIDGPVTQAGVYPASGTITRNVIQSVGGHACLLGAGITSATAQGNVVIGGSTPAGQGLVIKEGSNIVATDNLVFGGFQNTLYIKGAQSATLARNTAINLYSAGFGLHIDANLDANGSKFSNATAVDNYVVSGTGTAILYGPPANEIGSGSVVDRNVYDVRGSAVWGSLRGTTVSSLATVQAAWTGYATAGNDVRSLTGVTANTTNYRHTATAGATPTIAGPFLYRVITDRFGNAWNGTAFVPQVASNWYQYISYLVEPSLATYFFVRGVPVTLPAGDYKATLFAQTGSGPALGDTKLESQSFSWDGTQLVQFGAINTTVTGVKAKTDNLPASPAAVGSPMTLPDDQHAAIATAVLTDANPANQGTPGTLGAVVKSSKGVFATGVIFDTSPSTRQFVIMLDEGQTLPDTPLYVDLWLWFNEDSPLSPGKKQITGYQKIAADQARLTFQSPWSAVPTNESTFQIG